jgi:peptide/nickel transport system substrate-binding protein
VIDLGAGASNEPATLDPDIDYDNGDYSILSQIYSRLVKATGSKVASIRPDLATSWSESKNGLTWTFHLRPNVKFHSGNPVTSKDVKFTFDRALRLKQGGWSDWAEIKSVTTPNPLTVVFHLQYPFATFLQSMSGVENSCILDSVTVLAHQTHGDLGQKWLHDHDAGSGAYELQTWTHGQQIELQRFPGYYAGWAGNHIDNVIYQYATASSTIRLGLESGSIDAAMGLQPQDFNALQKNQSVTVYNNQPVQPQYFAMNTTQGPLNNRLVRLALAYSLDTSKIAKYVWGGYASTLKSYAPPGIPGYAESPTPYVFNLAKAQQLLRQAGVQKGLSVQATAFTGDTSTTLEYQIWQSDLAKIGIHLTIKVIPYAQFGQLQQKASTQPLIVSNAWGLDYASDATIYYGFLYSKSPSVAGNYAYYKNPKVDALLLEARSLPSVSSPRAAALYRQIQKLSFADAPYIPVVLEPARSVVRKNVHGYQYNLSETVYDFNLYDMWKS